MIAAVVNGLLRRPWVALVAVLVIEVLVYVPSQGDFVVSDPLWYADLANRIAIDPGAVYDAPENHPFLMRVGLTWPLALLYRALGVSVAVTNLPCLMAALGIVIVVYAAAPSPRAKLLGMLLCVGCAALMRATRLLGPDLPCAALMACSTLWLSRRDRPRGAVWVAAAMLAWFAAFLVKESALWCAPVWLYAMGSDLRAGGPRRALCMFGPALAIGAALGIAYLAVCARVWGDPWARFSSVEHLGHSWQLQGQPASEWIGRLTWQPALLLVQMFWAILVPAVLAPWLVRGPERIWWIATASIVLLFWVGSSSRLEYTPLPVLPRMAYPALPCVLVLATLGADRAVARVLERARGGRGARWLRGAAFASGVAVVIPSLLTAHKLVIRDHPETAAYAALRGELGQPGRRVLLVCGDPSCVPISAFYFGFEPPSGLEIALGADFARGPRPEGVTVRAIVNLRRSVDARAEDPQRERSLEIEALGLPELVRRRWIRLYDAGDGRRLWEALRAVP